MLKQLMNILQGVYVTINNQLLFITEEEELNTLLNDILHWSSTQSTISHLSTLSLYYTYKRVHLTN